MTLDPEKRARQLLNSFNVPVDDYSVFHSEGVLHVVSDNVGAVFASSGENLNSLRKVFSERGQYILDSSTTDGSDTTEAIFYSTGGGKNG